MKKLRLKNIKCLLLGHIARMCLYYTRPALNPPYTHFLGLSAFNEFSGLCMLVCKKRINIFWWRFSSSLSLLSPLAHYLWASPAFSDSYSWDPGMTSRTMLIQSQKTFLFQGLLAHHQSGKWEDLNKNVSSWGVGREWVCFNIIRLCWIARKWRR